MVEQARRDGYRGRRDIPEVKWAAGATALLGAALGLWGFNQALGASGAGLAGNILQVFLGVLLLAMALALWVLGAAWSERRMRRRPFREEVVLPSFSSPAGGPGETPAGQDPPPPR